MVKFGEPISLKPYYERYKSKPRTVKREINALVKEKISALMLNIEDLDNYDSIDYIRTTYGKSYAAQKGTDTNYLPDMLVSDKEFCKRLDEFNCENPEQAAAIYDLASREKEGVKKLGIRSEALEKRPSAICTLLKALLAIVFIEVYIFSLWPALFLYAIPKLMHKKMSTDIMFLGTYYFAFNVLFFIPIFTIATLLITFFSTGSWLLALAHVALLPLLAIIACKYTKFIVKIANINVKKM